MVESLRTILSEIVFSCRVLSQAREATVAEVDGFVHGPLATALAEAEARGRRQGLKWQPIETAPKDGTTILLAHEHAAFDGWWAACIGWVDGDTDGMEDLQTYDPTHWMPLPSLPLATTSPETQKPETGESAALSALRLAMQYLDRCAAEDLGFYADGDKPETDACTVCTEVAAALGIDLEGAEYRDLVAYRTAGRSALAALERGEQP